MESDEPISVLVVDESEAFLASTLRWIESREDLRLAGTARSASEALDAVARCAPDLVIVEAVLQGTDGFQLAREIKLRAGAPLVLLVTFHASVAVRDEALAAGADGFLPKYDFSDGFELLLADWKRGRGPRAATTPATPGRRGSRTAPDP